MYHTWVYNGVRKTGYFNDQGYLIIIRKEPAVGRLSVGV
jgi:hypothetical protein